MCTWKVDWCVDDLGMCGLMLSDLVPPACHSVTSELNALNLSQQILLPSVNNLLHTNQPTTSLKPPHTAFPLSLSCSRALTSPTASACSCTHDTHNNAPHTQTHRSQHSCKLLPARCCKLYILLQQLQLNSPSSHIRSPHSTPVPHLPKLSRKKPSMGCTSTSTGKRTQRTHPQPFDVRNMCC